MRLSAATARQAVLAPTTKRDVSSDLMVFLFCASRLSRISLDPSRLRLIHPIVWAGSAVGHGGPQLRAYGDIACRVPPDEAAAREEGTAVLIETSPAARSLAAPPGSFASLFT